LERLGFTDLPPGDIIQNVVPLFVPPPVPLFSPVLPFFEPFLISDVTFGFSPFLSRLRGDHGPFRGVRIFKRFPLVDPLRHPARKTSHSAVLHSFGRTLLARSFVTNRLLLLPFPGQKLGGRGPPNSPFSDFGCSLRELFCALEPSFPSQNPHLSGSAVGILFTSQNTPCLAERPRWIAMELIGPLLEPKRPCLWRFSLYFIYGFFFPERIRNGHLFFSLPPLFFPPSAPQLNEIIQMRSNLRPPFPWV